MLQATKLKIVHQGSFLNDERDCAIFILKDKELRSISACMRTCLSRLVLHTDIYANVVYIRVPLYFQVVLCFKLFFWLPIEMISRENFIKRRAT